MVKAIISGLILAFVLGSIGYIAHNVDVLSNEQTGHYVIMWKNDIIYKNWEPLW